MKKKRRASKGKKPARQILSLFGAKRECELNFERRREKAMAGD